ncbi:MAG: hypothetical protein RLZZ347_78 [Candidatus Parcubacteria bacterium]|jgi:hypothetical protein
MREASEYRDQTVYRHTVRERTELTTKQMG